MMRLHHDLPHLAGERSQVNGGPQKRLAGKVAVVTGSSRGIGKAIVKALAAEGAIVAVHYVRGRDPADQLAGELERAGTRASVFHADVARPEDCHKLLEQAAKQLGPVDILVNNAGINRDRSIRKMSAAEWDEVIQTNLNSVFHCSKAALEPMISRGWGRIINIASIIGQTGAFGQANYAAAKAGLLGFTKSLAKELASRNITVNAVAPGFIDTDMTRTLSAQQRDALLTQIPMGRLGTADDVAAAVLFLVSPQAAYVTGETLHVNGGMYMP
jgi:3-oxoacyl-[acyl-carrier protein] reductase